MIELDTLGYNLFPRVRPESPGFPRVDIVFRAKPSGVHFDPEKMHFLAVTPDGDIDPMTIRHPWPPEPAQLQIVAGRVILEDRFEKRVEFFSLGGNLSIFGEETTTLCEFESPVPIIELSLTRSASELLAEEIEGVLAQRRAFWERRPFEFDKRLAAANPLVLYAACLVTLRESFAKLPHDSFDEPNRHLMHLLENEIDALQSVVNKDLSRLSIEQIV